MRLIYRIHSFYSQMDKLLVTNRVECLKALEDLHIAYKLYEHDAVFNMEEMAAKVKLEKSPLIKSLLFSDKKPNTHFMILAETSTKPEKGIFFMM
jgi:hypothetical protein